MTRALFAELLLFFLPFALFAAYLVLQGRNPFHWPHWSNRTVWLAIAGLVCAIVALVIGGLTTDRESGAYQPSHVEDGRIVPGRFR